MASGIYYGNAVKSNGIWVTGLADKSKSEIGAAVLIAVAVNDYVFRMFRVADNSNDFIYCKSVRCCCIGSGMDSYRVAVVGLVDCGLYSVDVAKNVF